MRVVLATHRTNQWLGVNKYFYLLGKYLAKMDVQVRFVVDSLKGAENIKEICDSSENIEIVKLSPAATDPVSTLIYCDVLSSYLVKHNDFDILHCGHVLPFLYLLSGRLLKAERKPVVFQPFGNELFTLAGRGINKWYCKLAQPILRYCGEHAHVLLSEGAFQVNEMFRYYPKAKWVVDLPVGVDVNTYKPKSNYRNESPFQFVSVNSLLSYEAADELIESFRGMDDKHILVIVGKGSEEWRLRKLARGLQVLFLKDLSENELRGIYFDSDAFVCPTYETDYQMGVLEAMASGLPVIAREADWLPKSVIRFNVNGSGLRDKMAWLSSQSAAKRALIAEKGLKEVRQYDYTNIARTALNIYSEVLD